MELTWRSSSPTPAGPDVRALLEGARVVSRDGNRVAAIALLWSAVALSPTDLVAHRRLAATLANAGDRQAAADEYARFVEFALKAHDVERAQRELAYGLALLGPQPALVGAASRVRPALAMPPLRTLEPPAVRRVSMVEPLRRLAVVSATLVAAITVLFYASSLILLIN